MTTSEYPQVQWKVIAEHFRNRIISGELPVSFRLPSTQELARQFGTSVFSVQYAIRSLVHEGLVIRRPRYGTVVADHLPELKLAGLPLFSSRKNGISPFSQYLQIGICNELRKRNIECITLIEDYDDPDAVEHLKEQIRSLGIQALIHFCTKPEISNMLKSMNIPVITLDAVTKSRYLTKHISYHSRLEQTCQAVIQSGGIRPALITGEYIRLPNPCGNKYKRQLRSVLRKYRIKLPMNRIVSRPEPVPWNTAECCEFARNALHELWNCPDKPDVLCVFPDDLIPGTVLAAAELGIRIPEELKLIFHRNRQIDSYVPFPYTAVQLDLDAEVAMYVNALTAVFKHEPVPPYEEKYNIVSYQPNHIITGV